jgi:hypothetical protein
MKKTTLTLLAVLALAAFSATAMAAVSAPTSPAAFEFTLGGYIKMETSWDSTQINKNMSGPVLRNNDPNFHHGRLKFTANSSRFNFNFKGPKIWGAQITGLIEADFDADGGVNPAAAAAGAAPGVSADTVGTGRFRLRHAMFRLNWPETELMMGQFWGFFSNFTPETANDAGLFTMGAPSQRLAQVRVTQKFLGAYTAAMLVGAPFNNPDAVFNAAPAGVAALGTGGESSEGPQVQGMVAFEQDLWGKAPFYGVPRGFVAQLSAGWQRNRFRSGSNMGNTFDQDRFGASAGVQRDNENLNAWMAQGSLFIPVIPTYSANLAGTASLLTQWNVGQGLAAFAEGTAADFSYFTDHDDGTGTRKLQKRFTGFVQGQYYFTNQWFMNLAWGMSKAFGVDRDGFRAQGAVNTNTGANDPTWFSWQLHSTLWYRPITSLKFGLQYSYGKTHFFQKTGANAADDNNSTVNGENHRVMFAGFWYF